jgi:hypothetical protein
MYYLSRYVLQYTAWSLKMLPIGCPETSVTNHQSMVRQHRRWAKCSFTPRRNVEIKHATQYNRRSCTEAVVTFREGPEEVEFCPNMDCSCVGSNRHVQTTGFRWGPNFNSMESCRPQHELPTAFFIAQQHSSATFVSLLFNSSKEIFCARSIKFISIVFKILFTNKCTLY